MKGLDSLVKPVFGNLLSVFLKIAAYMIFGILLNLVLLAVQWEWIVSLFTESSPLEDKAIGSIILTVAALSPVAYFFLGQKQAIQNLLSNILKHKKYDVIYWLVNRLHQYKPDLFLPKGMAQLTSIKVVQYTIEALTDLPGMILKIMTPLINKINFSDKFVSAINEVEIKQNSTTDNVEKVAIFISNMVPEDIIEPDIKFPLILIIVNSSFFFL